MPEAHKHCVIFTSHIKLPDMDDFHHEGHNSQLSQILQYKSRIKWTDRDYRVQDNSYAAHKDVNIYCDTNQFLALPFCGTHPKPRGERGFSKHYNLCFYPKIGHGICEIRRISRACVGCTSILDKPWIYGIPSKKQARYQPFTNSTCWPVMGSYNNWNIIEITPKSTYFDAIDDIHKVVLDGISENMASLVQSGMYSAINTADNTSYGFYIIKFISEAYTLKKNTTIYGQVISAGELVVKAQYLCYMQ